MKRQINPHSAENTVAWLKSIDAAKAWVAEIEYRGVRYCNEDIDAQSALKQALRGHIDVRFRPALPNANEE